MLKKEVYENLRELTYKYMQENKFACRHEWKEPVYEPITEFNTNIPVWSRECDKCGKIEYTNRFQNENVLIMVPRFR